LVCYQSDGDSIIQPGRSNCRVDNRHSRIGQSGGTPLERVTGSHRKLGAEYAACAWLSFDTESERGLVVIYQIIAQNSATSRL